MRSPNQNSPQPNKQSRNPEKFDPVLDIPSWVHGLAEPERGRLIEICRCDPLLRSRCREAGTQAMRRACISAARQWPVE